MAGVRRGTFTCVGWQVTMRDPIWQVTFCSSETGSHEELYRFLPFFMCGHHPRAVRRTQTSMRISQFVTDDTVLLSNCVVPGGHYRRRLSHSGLMSCGYTQLAMQCHGSKCSNWPTSQPITSRAWTVFDWGSKSRGPHFEEPSPPFKFSKGFWGSTISSPAGSGPVEPRPKSN